MYQQTAWFSKASSSLPHTNRPHLVSIWVAVLLIVLPADLICEGCISLGDVARKVGVGLWVRVLWGVRANAGRE